MAVPLDHLVHANRHNALPAKTFRPSVPLQGEEGWRNSGPLPVSTVPHRRHRPAFYAGADLQFHSLTVAVHTRTLPSSGTITGSAQGRPEAGVSSNGKREDKPDLGHGPVRAKQS